MIASLKNSAMLKLLRKKPWYCRFRRYLPGAEPDYCDESADIEDAEVVKIDWPSDVPKPRVGVVRDFDPYPRWTKYVRFLEKNSFDYEIYDIHAHDWLKTAENFEVVVGIWSCEPCYLEELREKYYFLETFLGKCTFPSAAHALLYENKRLEAYIASAQGIPFATTYVSHSKEDALRLIQTLAYPLVSKFVPSSGSVGVQLLSDSRQAKKIVEQAFSPLGRKTHMHYVRQKNYIYFQKFIPNDGYDIRVILVGNWAFGYYRKALKGDFRASGMNLVEKRDLPKPAIAIALKLNAIIKSPMLVVDMLHGSDGQYTVIEYSPACQMETPEQFHLNGVPGVLICDEDANCHFEPHRYWAHELALREFLLADYLPKNYSLNSTSPLLSIGSP
jgi:glutathione synthase/RimK-type ligase-like ATP-grasp enzyme